jgi:5-methylthioribose kinase
MRYIEPPHTILRKQLIAGNILSTIATDIGTFLAKTLFFTSELHLPASQFRQNVIDSTNPELCKLTEAVVFTDPYVPNDKVSQSIQILTNNGCRVELF